MNLPIEFETAEPPSMNSVEPEPSISVHQIGVEYQATGERINTFKEYAIRGLKGGIKREKFRALHDVSFDVRRSEVFGVIGHNGAGKSTLLKVVSRVIKPTAGRVIVRGSVAPLLELGAGFHPELTGRENVYLNGTLLGFKRAEIDAMFEEIVEFAELWEFIDAPLRTYSTGMSVRLGFAVATAKRPDVLLVDEVLSVGDAAFQQKCSARMAEFRESGTTILLVTHDVSLVLSMCDRALWLDHGKCGALGPPALVVEAYQSRVFQSGAVSRSGTRMKTPAKRSGPALQIVENDEISKLVESAMKKSWLYPYELPGAGQTPCLLPPEIAAIHQNRFDTLVDAIEPLSAGEWKNLSCLDLGCGQGYFAVKLAELGCRPVAGVDAREINLKDAELIKKILGLEALSFHRADLMTLDPKRIGRYDVVLLFGMLYQLENPVGALRVAKSLARKMVVIETQLAPEVGGKMNWGASTIFKSIEGSFALLDRSDETQAQYGSLTPIALCPGRNALARMMELVGFSKVEILEPRPDDYEQFVSGHRAMVLGYL
jgi:ABC-2 type transport system ATP-binding protein